MKDALGSLAYGLNWGVVGAVVGTGVSALQLAIATEQVAQAEVNLARKRQVALEMDLSLKRVTLDLEGTECRKRKLVRIITLDSSSPKLINILGGSIAGYFNRA